MSRDELAQRIDRSTPHLANIENEFADVKVEVLHRIARELDIRVEAICRRPLYAEAEAVSA